MRSHSLPFSLSSPSGLRAPRKIPRIATEKIILQLAIASGGAEESRISGPAQLRAPIAISNARRGEIAPRSEEFNDILHDQFDTEYAEEDSEDPAQFVRREPDRKSTRLNSSHV